MTATATSSRHTLRMTMRCRRCAAAPCMQQANAPAGSDRLMSPDAAEGNHSASRSCAQELLDNISSLGADTAVHFDGRSRQPSINRAGRMVSNVGQAGGWVASSHPMMELHRAMSVKAGKPVICTAFCSTSPCA